jgi:hypothetical protein
LNTHFVWYKVVLCCALRKAKQGLVDGVGRAGVAWVVDLDDLDETLEIPGGQLGPPSRKASISAQIDSRC